MDKPGSGAAAQTAQDLGVIAGSLNDIKRGLAMFGDHQIERTNRDVDLLFQKISTLGQALSKYAGRNWEAPSNYELGQVVDYLELYTTGKQAQPGQKAGGAKQSEAIKFKLARKLLAGLKSTLVDMQKALMTPTFSGEWNKLRPYVQRTNEMLNGVLKSIPAESKKRRSLTLENKLHGRLATANIVNTHNRDLAGVELRRMYGPRLASLVESGNQKAIKLAQLINERRTLQSDTSRIVHPVLLERLEQPINHLSRALGLVVNEDNLDLLSLMNLANSPWSFKSSTQFKSNLTEGLILNVTKLASNALSIPSGEYVVWTTNARSTMLVPTTEAKADSSDVVVDQPAHFDIVTTDLLGCWNKVERVIGEANSGYDDAGGNYENPASGSERIGRPSLKKKVEAAGGVRAAAEMTGLSPGDVSKHVNNREFEVAGDSARAYMRGIGADPDDLYQYGEIKVADYDSSNKEAERTDRERAEGQAKYDRAERERSQKTKRDQKKKPASATKPATREQR